MPIPDRGLATDPAGLASIPPPSTGTPPVPFADPQKEPTMTTTDPARLMRDIELYAGACMEVQKLEALGDQECAERQRVFVNRRHDAIESTVYALAADSQGARS